ncbi:ADYC domain-containing protein [Paraliomyxa miuraensis]|uniref:ADYC domain-containing protein n=1 Tax=Paraliomyxa miuraensis TaxID=376150 RepID=UPI00225630F2|nr:ADYC domain-containing protein [Paraliomyxa miuraensis]MCX4239682.1 ADYC domain-containing protein [Paraliomyxa miuraensis]
MAVHAIYATALLVLPGCDPEPADFDDEDWSFRCTQLNGCQGGGTGGVTGGGGNTSFLGQINTVDVFPLNNLPLDGTAHGDVRIESIAVAMCIDRAGFVGPGISEINPTLSVDATGKLLTKTMTRTGDPSTECDVYDDYWVGSKWTISYDLPEGPTTSFQTVLTINGITIDGDGAPLYEIWLDSDTVPDDRTGPKPLCGYADEENEPGMDFEAYFIPEIGIDEDGGLLTVDDTVFIGCISGSYGKAEYWGYKHFIPEIGMSGFEVANNALRAEYCGDDVTYTEPNTPIWFQSIFTDEGPDPLAPPATSNWELEAVWSDDPTEPALCVGTTRLSSNQPLLDESFDCPIAPLPICDSSYFSATGAVLATWAWTGD